MIVQVNDALAEAEQRRGIAGEVMLAVADADDQRAAEASADEQVGVARTDDRQAVGPLHHAEHMMDGLDQIAVIVAGDELGDDLAVGVALEENAVVDQLALERLEVLDDAVVYDGDLSIGRKMRMGV